MITLYGYTILVDLALLAIVIAIFVFAISIYKGASELRAKEEENASTRRKELIESRKMELTRKMPAINGSAFSSEVRAELDELDNETRNIDRAVLKTIKRAKSLTARNLVFVPGFLLIVSIIGSGMAIPISGALQTVMWLLSLLFLAVAFYFTCRNICAIEFFSSSIDLSTLMEQALERHTQKMRPRIDMGIPSYYLVIKHGETGEIRGDLFVKQGLTAKDVKVRFCGTEELDFPEEKIARFDFDKKNMKKPKIFYREIGNLNYGVYHPVAFKAKVPNAIGEYAMSYWITSDDFTSEEQYFTIKVI